MAFRLEASFIALVLATSAAATTITTNTTVAANQTFDYVIVGAGPGGITVGNKVCPSFRVLSELFC